MGGNALKAVATHLLPAASYLQLAAQVMDTLQSESGLRVELVRNFGTKADFGDMCVIADRSTLPADVPALMSYLFNPHEVVSNGNVISFDVAAFQVDLVCVPASEYDTARDYFAFNDLGNLMGRTAQRMGFTYGQNGLRYKVLDGDYLVDDLTITNEMPAAFAFLGYDYGRFDQGFHTLEEVFAFAASSTHFNPAAYPLESRGHRDRVRDQKLQNYRLFLEWLQTAGVAAGASADLQRAHHLQGALKQFPAFAEALSQSQEALAGARRRKQLFNSRIVSELTGLEGRELGHLMREVHDAYPGGRAAFVTWLDQLEDHKLAPLHAYIREVAADLITSAKNAVDESTIAK
ncbi:hypothetical protein [Xanthomonas hortorum]|uniref:hypothetical protein n=1 Tax=Xanthomonas hortorum TaxID=56454 RepID=UPI000A747877|nr:hypothetical protein [Xanthomonas hortorum]